jgi:HEAT repeat protein
MKRLPLVLAMVAGLVVSAAGDPVMLTTSATQVLTQLDTLPSSAQLERVLGTPQAVLDKLIEFTHADFADDPGVQIRAVRAIAQYCDVPCTDGSEAHVALATLLTTPRYRDARAGSDLLVLRAGIEALGVLRVATDIDLLIPQLAHPNRDIRAAAARALRDLGNTAAIDALRGRYSEEQVPQVELAIADALRVLGQPVP